MKILVTGAGGNIGIHIASHLSERHNVIGTCNQHIPTKGLIHMDITDQDAVFASIDKNEPDLVIHAAALADSGACHRDHDLAKQVNVQGTFNVAQACSRVGARLIHISTDMVFDGISGGYLEDDIPSPISVYGKTKAMAEDIVMYTLPNAAVLRTAIVFGTGSGKRPNFFEGLLNQIKSGSTFKIITDEYRSYLYVENVGQICERLATGSHSGIFHVGGEKSSRHDIVLRLLHHFGLNDKTVEPVTIAELNEESPRPADLSLDCSKTFAATGFTPIDESEGFNKFERMLNL